MLKTNNLLGLQLLLSLLLVAEIASPGLTQAPPAPDDRGLCQLNNIGGRAIIDPQGQLIGLTDFCRQQPTTQPTESQSASNASNASGDDQSQSGDKEHQDEEFWRSFNQVASPDAVQFSDTLDRQQILAYSTTICPYLNNGGTLQQIRQIQATGKLPTSFDVAVTIAAIHTYCPEYTVQIGR
jgi:hypothetical protein